MNAPETARIAPGAEASLFVRRGLNRARIVEGYPAVKVTVADIWSVFVLIFVQ